MTWTRWLHQVCVRRPDNHLRALPCRVALSRFFRLADPVADLAHGGFDFAVAFGGRKPIQVGLCRQLYIGAKSVGPLPGPEK